MRFQIVQLDEKHETANVRILMHLGIYEMLQNAYFLAKIGADTAENEQHFAEILSIGRRVAVKT